MQNKIIKLLILVIIVLTFIWFKNDILYFLVDLKNSFYRTIIEEDRYQLLLTGLLYTIIISLASILLGTIFGGFVCYLRRSKNTILKNIGKIFIGILRGVPITVLLLVFYYVLFESVDINPVIVSIIAFGLYFSAYAAEVFRSAIDSIHKSQIESAYSLGFSKTQTLKYIVLPQAISYALPVYKNEVVSLIKLTSIAGYISVMDLTKASDIIRNRTYEAFFPLILTAIIYFLICYFVGKLLDVIYNKINTRSSSQENKNVRI